MPTDDDAHVRPGRGDPRDVGGVEVVCFGSHPLFRGVEVHEDLKPVTHDAAVDRHLFVHDPAAGAGPMKVARMNLDPLAAAVSVDEAVLRLRKHVGYSRKPRMRMGRKKGFGHLEVVEGQERIEMFGKMIPVELSYREPGGAASADEFHASRNGLRDIHAPNLGLGGPLGKYLPRGKCIASAIAFPFASA